MKKVIPVLLALSLTSAISSTFAADTKTAEITATKTTFTVSEAVDYMLANSLEIKAENENISYLELKQKADAGMRKRLNGNEMTSSITLNSFNTMLATDGFNEYSDGVQLAIAKRSLGDTKYKLTMQLENKFYSCLNADRKIIVAQEALSNAQDNERIAKARNAEGLIGDIEASSFSIAVIQSQNDYNDAVSGRDYMYAELKQMMGYPSDADITLTGTFERKPISTVSLSEALAGLDKTANKLNLDAGIELQEKLLKEYKALYTNSMPDYQAQKFAYAKAESEYNDNIGKLRLGIINTYNTMTSTYGKLDYIDKAIELKEKQADAQKTSYELGLSTSSQYITAVQELDALKLSLVDAEIGAYLTSKAYEMTFHPAD